jgi:ribosomal protein S27E
LLLLQSVHLSTQKPLHHIGFGDILLRMLTPKDLNIIIIKVTCIDSLKCKIIFNITSTYITSVICGNVGFLARIITLEVAYSMTTVALNIGDATGGCG